MYMYRWIVHTKRGAKRRVAGVIAAVAGKEGSYIPAGSTVLTSTFGTGDRVCVDMPFESLAAWEQNRNAIAARPPFWFADVHEDLLPGDVSEAWRVVEP